MKNLFITLFLIVGFAAYGQRSAIVEATGANLVYGKTATTIILPTKLHQEYDYSYQIIPSKVGSGDSINSAVALWQSNTHAGTSWTEITSARDTVDSTNGLLIEGTNATGMRHKLILTGTVLDTSSNIVYQVLKLDNEF